jgi:hypothetical protein
MTEDGNHRMVEELTAGDYTFPFEIPLPQYLLPSFFHKFARGSIISSERTYSMSWRAFESIVVMV